VRFAVTFRYATIAGMLALLFLVATAFSTGFVRFVFFPPTEADRVELTLTMVDGASFATTRAAAEEALVAAAAVDAAIAASTGVSVVRTTSATIGTTSRGGGPPGGGVGASGSNVAQIRVELTPSDSRSIGSVEFETRWRAELGGIVGADSMTFMSGLFVPGDDISVELSDPDDTQLIAAAEALRSGLNAITGVSDIEFSLQFGQRQLEFALNDQGRALGLSESDLARQIRRAFFGETMQTLQRGTEEVDVVVRYPVEARSSLADVYDMRVRLPSGEAVPVTTVATITEGRAFATIERADGRRILRVTAKVDPDLASADNINADLRESLLPELTERFVGLDWQMTGQAADQAEDLRNIFTAMGVAMLGIYVMMASVTRSYVQPIVILSTVIYGVIGAVAGHILLGYPMTFISLFGIVALAGVVVNATILLLDDYHKRRARAPDLARVDAIVDSAARRFRPIFLTTV
jgi:multidrug efflux pump subunit AcrB